MTKRPDTWPRSPQGCPHRHGQKYDGDEIMRKDTVIGHHIRCSDCGLMIETEMYRDKKEPDR